MLFFVLPALGNLQRRLRGGGEQDDADQKDTAKERQRQREGRPGQPPKTATGTPSAPTRASTQTTRPTPQPTQASDLPRWLEEAQRRVRDAQASEPSRSRPDARTGGPTRGKPLFDPLPEQPTARPTRTQPTQARPVQARPEARPVQARPVGSADRTDRTAKTAPPLRVQRLNENKRATLEPDLRFDVSTVMNGIAWHQVLSPPLSKRRTRLSQRRP